jgi:hypothetical protein
MKRLILLGIVFGFGGTLAAAHWVPWVGYERVPSQTSVVANGGRQERFVIRLPADRIAAFGPQETLRSHAYPEDAAIATGDIPPPLIEHFKIRDSAGNVIGVAARHRVSMPEGAESAWLLSIPGRGSLALVGPGESDASIDSALQSRGFTPASAWTGDVALALAADRTATRTVAATGEFTGLDVRFTETWELTGVSETGELRGTIELDTIGQRAR